jgi:hypothetical protein
MTEPESGSSDIVVLPGAAKDQPEEFDAAVTQLIELAKDDFAREERSEAEEASDGPQAGAVPPRSAASGPHESDDLFRARETVKMPSRSMPPPRSTVEGDESGAIPMGLQSPGGLEAETDPFEEEERAATRPLDQVPATGTMTMISTSKPWWKTVPAVAGFAVGGVAILALVLIPILSSDSDDGERSPGPEEVAADTVETTDENDEADHAAMQFDSPAQANADDAVVVDVAEKTQDERAKAAAAQEDEREEAEDDETTETPQVKPSEETEPSEPDETTSETPEEKTPREKTRRSRTRPRRHPSRKKPKPDPIRKLEVPKFD